MLSPYQTFHNQHGWLLAQRCLSQNSNIDSSNHLKKLQVWQNNTSTRLGICLSISTLTENVPWYFIHIRDTFFLHPLLGGPSQFHWCHHWPHDAVRLILVPLLHQWDKDWGNDSGGNHKRTFERSMPVWDITFLVFLTFLPTTHPLQQTYDLPMTHEGEGPDPNTGNVPEQAKLDFTNALCGVGPKASQHKDFSRWVVFSASARDEHYVLKWQIQLV